jgi:hypothetical protein
MASRINSYVIQLAPASAAFIANRTTPGSWVPNTLFLLLYALIADGSGPGRTLGRYPNGSV